MTASRPSAAALHRRPPSLAASINQSNNLGSLRALTSAGRICVGVRLSRMVPS